MATYPSILACKIPWTEEPGRLQSVGSQTVRHHWATGPTHIKKREKILLFSLFCSIWALNRLDDAYPHWWRWSLLSLQIQMLIVFGNTPKDIPRKTALPPGHSLAQSNWHLELTSTGTDGNWAKPTRSWDRIGGEILDETLLFSKQALCPDGYSTGKALYPANVFMDFLETNNRIISWRSYLPGEEFHRRNNWVMVTQTVSVLYSGCEVKLP